MATTVVYADPKEMPATLSIGTQKAFVEGCQYKYRFVEELKLYLCHERTSTWVDGEVMAISMGSDDHGNTWYAASEGQLSQSGDGQRFHGRQIVFRTQEQFWEPGEHEWQLNANSSATNTNNTVWGDRTDALTKVPENVSVVSAAVGLLQIADAYNPVV